MPVTTNFDSYAVAHNKNGSGGNTYVMGGQNSGTYNSLNVHSINANLGNIDTLKSRSISANESSILYLQTREGSINKLSGDVFNFNSGYVGSLASDSISTKKLKAEDIEAVNAFISTLQSKEITTEYLTVTKQAHFFELVIDKIRSVGGQLILTPASCIIDYVYGVTQNGTWVKPTEQNYNSLIAFDVFWRSTEDSGRNVTNDFIPGDQAICQSFNNANTGTNYNISNKYYWRLVESVQDDVWINLSTGAVAPSQAYATNNKYEISMLNTVTKDEINSTTRDTYRDNGIMWQCEAQQIIGYQTNVSWTDNTLGYNQAINGIFETASMVYGIQITPSASNTILGITSRLEFYIKQIVDNSYIIPNKINIGVYFQDDTFKVFNDVALDSTSGYVSLNLDNPEAPIEAITIVSTSDVNWHQCHTMRISNVTCDKMLDGYSSIPSAGDNLIQLGYRGQDDADRQSAIIISAYKSPDPGVHAPSYAAYMGINDFDLASHRGSYIDARGAKFVGDITMCSVDGQSIGDTFDDIEKKNKKILVNTATIQVWPHEGSISGQVYAIDPSNINVTILTPGQNGMDLLNYVPEGYVVDFNFFNTNNGSYASQYDFYKVQNESLLDITMPTGQYIGDINSVRIRLIKDEYGVPPQNAIVVDYVDIPYIQAVVPVVDGGKWEFRYCNHTPTEQYPLPVKPTEGSNGIGSFAENGLTSVWDSEGHTPDVEHDEFTFMSQCYCTAANQYGEWTTPFRITGGNGKNGEDGTDIEYIYTRRHEVWDNPIAPSYKSEDDWNGYDETSNQTWTDNPQGVSEDYKFEYVSMRTKQPGASWSNYSTPVIWSNWGEKGQDGDGFEYIFRLTDSMTPPDNPTPNDWNSANSNYQTQDEYAPYLSPDWSDDPVSVSQNNRYLYVSKRIRNYDSAYNRVLWHPFSEPALWARYAEQGETGGHYEFRYCNHTPVTGNLLPDKPTTGTDGTTRGWSRTPSNPDVNNGEYTYMSQCYLTPGSPNDTYGEWTNPVRITGGGGEDGADGTDIEFIYTQKSSIWRSAKAPTVADDPTIAQDDWPNVDGQTTEKTINGTTWYDNPRGVTSSERYEYMCVRYKYAGTSTWTEYSTPVIWSAFGDKGQDGDGFEYIYKLTPTSNASEAGNPTPNDYATNSTYQSVNEYCTYINNPAGQEPWTDDPQGVSENKKFEWVSVRTRTNGVWSAYSAPAIWARWAMPGQSGGHYEFRYANFTPTSGHTNPTKPTAGSNGIGTYGSYKDAATWGYTTADPNVNMGEYTYMTQCYVDGDDTYGTWTDPIRITGGDGKPGEDGSKVEFIYKHFKTAQTFNSSSGNDNPANWPANSNPDYLGPSGKQWSDNPNGVDDEYLFEYISTRSQENGTWTTFSTPVIWSKYGEKGMDGDGYEYMYKLADSAPTERLTPNDWENPTSNYQKHDEYYSYISGWSDEPLTPTAQKNKTVCWVAVRKKSNGVWQPFSSPSMWSMYVTAEGGQPGAPGANAQYNYLIPNKEVLMAKIIDAYANNGNCDLLCDLDYSLVHVDGDTVTTLDWEGYSLYIEAFNDSYTSIWYTTDYDGKYKQDNLMATINSVAAQRDYMKCYEDYRNRCPIYLEVSLKKGNTVLDKRNIPVQLETGAVLKVQKDGIRSIVGDTGGSTVTGWVQNNYSTKEQTADMISSTVSGSMTNYYDKNEVGEILESYSTIEQTADSITLRVESTLKDYYSKDETYSKSEMEQTANNIALNVYSKAGGVTSGDLKRTGIDITTGKIELTADNTVINGNLNVKESDTGLVIYDNNDTPSVTLLNRSVGKDPQGTSKKTKLSFSQEYTGSPATINCQLDFGYYDKDVNISISGGSFMIMGYNSYGNYEGTYNATWSASSQRNGWGASGNGTSDFGSKNTKSLSMQYAGSIIESFSFRPSYGGATSITHDHVILKVEFNIETWDQRGIKIGTDGAIFQNAADRYGYFGAEQICMRNGSSILRLKDGYIERNDRLFTNSGRNGTEMGGTLFGDVSGVVNTTVVTKTRSYDVTDHDTFIVMASSQKGDNSVYLKAPNNAPTGRIIYIKNIANGDRCNVYTSGGNYLIWADQKNGASYHNIGRAASMFINTGSYWVHFYCG